MTRTASRGAAFGTRQQQCVDRKSLGAGSNAAPDGSGGGSKRDKSLGAGCPELIEQASGGGCGGGRGQRVRRSAGATRKPHDAAQLRATPVH